MLGTEVSIEEQNIRLRLVKLETEKLKVLIRAPVSVNVCATWEESRVPAVEKCLKTTGHTREECVCIEYNQQPKDGLITLNI